jgi:hypothetical protein
MMHRSTCEACRARPLSRRKREGGGCHADDEMLTRRRRQRAYEEKTDRESGAVMLSVTSS